MKTSIYLTRLLFLILASQLSRAQPLLTNLTPASQCFSTMGGNAVVASVLSSPPGATSYSWIVSSTNATCSPMPPLVLSPNGSNVGFNFGCCGVYNISCTAFNAMNMPVGNFASTATISCPPSIALTTQPAGSVTCDGGSATLTASGASNYTWYPGGSSSGTLNPTSTGCYTLVGSAGSNCTTQAVSCVTVQALNLSVSPATRTVCSGSAATFTASGAGTYSWSNGMEAGNISVTPTVNSVYTVTGSVGSCASTQTVGVSVNATPTLNVASSNSIICKGRTATLTAIGNNTYTWSGSTSTGSSIVVSPSVTTGYTVSVTNTLGCTGKATITQSVNNCVGIEQLTGEAAHILAYPNPNSGIFTLKIKPGEGRASLEIYNTIGRQVLLQVIDDETSEIQLKDCPAGIYYASLQTAMGKSTFKIIISSD